VVVQKPNEAFAVRRLDEVDHLVDNHVLQEVLRLLHELCIEVDVPRTVIAATPLSLHALEKVT
jgi:hypothetical protein